MSSARRSLLTSLVIVAAAAVPFVSPAEAQKRHNGAAPPSTGPIAAAALAAVADLTAATTGTRQTTVRQSDPLWNGALIGASVAVASGLYACTRMEPWENCRGAVGPILQVAAIGAGVGIAIDALVRKKVAAPRGP